MVMNEFDWIMITVIASPFFMLGVLILLTVLVGVLWKGLQNQRRITKALEMTNKINVAMLETLKGIKSVPPDNEDDGEDVSVQDDGDGGVGETPADFVYCPVCSTRVEVDPSIRNVNVVCPDCKKPFHIH